MAYDLISEQVLGSAQSSVTFSSIPGTYKDLVLEYVGIQSPAVSNMSGRVGNGSVDTGSNYSGTEMSGNGSSAVSSRYSNDTRWYVNYNSTNTALIMTVMQFQNYANTNMNKTVLVRNTDATTYTAAYVKLWRSTSAINTIQLYMGTSFSSGATFRLWGIA